MLWEPTSRPDVEPLSVATYICHTWHTMKPNDPLPAICVLYSFWNHHNFPNQVHMCHMNYLLTQQKIQDVVRMLAPANPFTPPSSGASRNTSYRCLVPRRPWSFLRRPCIGLTFFWWLPRKETIKNTCLLEENGWVQTTFLVKTLEFAEATEGCFFVWQWGSHQKTWICLRLLCILYHGKWPLNHHLGNCVWIFPSILNKSKKGFRVLS